jgi:anti-sigma-K factor RskA
VLAAIASTEREAPESGGMTSEPVQVVTSPTPPVVSLESQRRKRVRNVLMAAAVVAVFAVGGVALVATGNDSSDPIAAVVEATDATTRSLSGEIDLTVTYSPSQDALVVQADGLPALTDDLTYQLWLVGDGGATSVGTFRPDDDGVVAERFGDADPTGFVLGVTREPAGGSESPTLPILATA